MSFTKYPDYPFEHNVHRELSLTVYYSVSLTLSRYLSCVYIMRKMQFDVKANKALDFAYCTKHVKESIADECRDKIMSSIYCVLCAYNISNFNWIVKHF